MHGATIIFTWSVFARRHHYWTYNLLIASKYARSNHYWVYLHGASMYARSNLHGATCSEHQSMQTMHGLTIIRCIYSEHQSMHGTTKLGRICSEHQCMHGATIIRRICLEHQSMH